MFGEFFKAVEKSAQAISKPAQKQIQVATDQIVRQAEKQMQAEIQKQIDKGAVSLASFLFSTDATGGPDSGDV
mgnify:CR=1 FL=1